MLINMTLLFTYLLCHFCYQDQKYLHYQEKSNRITEWEWQAS